MQKKRCLLIGWDAADWTVIHPLIEAGKMPNLANFLEQGVGGNLSTLYPVLSPMLWTSIATGKRAHQHGVHGFSEPTPEGGVRPISVLGRQCKAIWNILNQEGLRSNVVGWWPSAPAEPINGVMVSDQFHRAENHLPDDWPFAESHVHPPEWAERIRACRAHPHQVDGDVLSYFLRHGDEIDQSKDQRVMSVAKIIAECNSILSAAHRTLTETDWDFSAVYFDGIDHFGHGFMKYHPPRLPWIDEADFRFYSEVVNSGYQLHDMMLGEMIKWAGDDTNIIICSDHGFHANHLRPKELPNEPAGPADEHRQYGIFAAMGPDFKQNEMVYGASLLDITPTILQLYGLPVGEDMDGRPISGAFRQPQTLQFIDSWEARAGEDGRHPPDTRLAPVDQHEALQQLVDLGYIDGLDETQEEVTRNTVKELRYNLARDLNDSGKFQEAADVFAALWEENPGESRFGVHLYNNWLAQDNVNAARRTLDTLKQRKAEYAIKAGDELKQLQEDWQEAIENQTLTQGQRRRINKLMRQAGTNQASMAVLEGRLLHAEKRHGDALIMLEKAEDMQESSLPNLYQIQGNVFLAMRRWREAEAKFNQMLATDPVNAQAHFGLARSLMMQRERETEALAAVDSALALNQRMPAAHYLRGNALMRLGRRAEALHSYTATVQLNPEHLAAHRRLGRLHYTVNHDLYTAREHMGIARVLLQERQDAKAASTTRNTTHHTNRHRTITPLSLNEAIRMEASETDQRANAPLGKDEIVVVSGLPRSGTSMMMQMLQAGGVPILTDGKRVADEDNRKGYLEYEAVKISGINHWQEQAPGHAVKVISQLVPNMAAHYRYRFIFMQRDIEEVIASQQAMLTRNNKRGARLTPQKLAETYAQQVASMRTLLAERFAECPVMVADYQQALQQPLLSAAQINRFLGGQLDEQAMAAEIDPALRRQFGEELVLL